MCACAPACAPLRNTLALGAEPPHFVAAAVFTNVLKDSLLQELADADEGELVKQVQVASPRRRRMPACFDALHARLTPVRRSTTQTTGR